MIIPLMPPIVTVISNIAIMPVITAMMPPMRAVMPVVNHRRWRNVNRPANDDRSRCHAYRRRGRAYRRGHVDRWRRYVDRTWVMTDADAEGESRAGAGRHYGGCTDHCCEEQ